MIAGPIRCPVLVGRADELRELVERRLAAARGRGSCVLLSGDAGMGKSRLVATFRETLRGGRAAVGIGVAREFGNAPYGPLREALAGIGALAKLSHELSREEQLAAFSEIVAASCRRRHCVLIVEDAQWADEGSLRALLHLTPAIAAMRLLLIVTHRSDGVRESDFLAAFVARIQRVAETDRISLGRLADRDVRRMIKLTLGDRLRLPTHAVAEITERSEGSPFFAEELLKSALERRLSDGPVRTLPLTIRAAVLERYAALDDLTREILLRAAVLGRRFDASLLATICAKPQDEILAALRRLRELQIIEELAGSPARYSFRHELTREAVYGTMLREELQPLHHGILKAFEENQAGAYDLGYHAWAAGDDAKALRYNELAGDEAMAVHAYADARLCYERAISGAEHAAVRGRLLNKAADAAARDGKADVAASLYEIAANAFEVTGDRHRAADLYLAMSSQARVGGDTIASRTSLQRAVARLPAEAESERAKLSLALAFTYLDRCENDVADTLIAQSTAASATSTYASALNYAATVRGDLAAVREASALYLKRCEAQSPQAALQARFNLSFSLCVLGIDDEALAGFESLLPELSERRLRSLEVLTCANAALIHARAGRWDFARAVIERGLLVPEPTTTGPMALAAAGLTIAHALDDDALARRSAPSEAVEAALSSRINSTLGRFAGPYARWRHARGHAEEAVTVLRNAVESLAGPFGATETLLAAIELGDDAIRRNTRAFLSKLDAMAGLPLYAATAAEIRALESHRGADVAAGSDAEAAASLYRRLGWPLHELRMRELSAATTIRLSPAREQKGYASMLSARERQIAALVAQGIPNKTLAERLAVSQRTIEKHLTSIFAKLGLRNRTELTAFVVRRSADS